ncbi:catalase [Colletotrichum tabaci]|uniref:Catalase n=1 Tax=Colletotrichum tabaci TaxID=1209068 RepID=A0AAV9T957_9PEZI
MSDWQEAAFATRHLHNRASKSKAGGGRGRRGGAFEVRRTFGRYDVKCPSASRASPPPESGGKKGKRTAAAAARPTLDIFRLSDDGRGLLGELVLPGALEASVILTGSRKTLEDLMSQFEEGEEEGDEGQGEGGGEEEEIGNNREDDGVHDEGHGNPVPNGECDFEDEDGEDTSRHEESDDDDPDKERSRFRAFEKNSFRSPKFWFQWKGRTTTPSPSPPDDRGLAAGRPETGRGYVVFSGNDCRSFKGTITCDALGWKDASMSGWKEVSMSERDVAFAWS